VPFVDIGTVDTVKGGGTGFNARLVAHALKKMDTKRMEMKTAVHFIGLCISYGAVLSQ
jgi:hypothetical protein